LLHYETGENSVILQQRIAMKLHFLYLLITKPTVKKSSAVAEMTEQCCTNRIVAVEWEVPLFNTPFLNYL